MKFDSFDDRMFFNSSCSIRANILGSAYWLAPSLTQCELSTHSLFLPQQQSLLNLIKHTRFSLYVLLRQKSVPVRSFLSFVFVSIPSYFKVTVKKNRRYITSSSRPTCVITVHITVMPQLACVSPLGALELRRLFPKSMQYSPICEINVELDVIA